MKNLHLIVLLLFVTTSINAQNNLALTATASASASSSGSYGPSNWNDGIINGTTFGWVGTASTFPQPSYMLFTWPSAQTLDSVRIFNVGNNFSPPNGNGVVFSGAANLEYYDGSQWVLITAFTGQGTYSSAYDLSFSPVTTTQLRIANLTTAAPNHNPGFDEIEIYLSPQPAAFIDAELTSLDTLLDIANDDLVISALVTNAGNQVIDSVEVSYQVSGSATVINESFTNLGLVPGNDTALLFSQAIDLISLPSPLFTESLCGWASAAMDTNPSNDSLCLSLKPLTTPEDDFQHFSVYPNPGADKFTIESSHAIERISIYSPDGTLVYAKKYDSVFEAELRPQLAQGIYFLDLISEGRREMVRIIIRD